MPAKAGTHYSFHAVSAAETALIDYATKSLGLLSHQNREGSVRMVILDPSPQGGEKIRRSMLVVMLLVRNPHELQNVCI